jgi:iron complex transport system permease protein
MTGGDAVASGPAPSWLLPLGLFSALVPLCGLSLLAGQVSLDPGQVLAGLAGTGDEAYGLIVWHLRVPRTLLAVLVGTSLGLAGAVLQGLLRNPLAEPGLIGISTTAALGAVLVFYGGFAAVFILALPLGGMAGAAVSVVLLMGLSGRGASTFTLILAGVAVNSLAGALTALALNLSDNPYAATEIIFWMLGSLADRGFDHVWIATVFMLPGWLLMLGTGRALDALTLGEETAASLGFNLASLRWRSVLGTALAVGAAVSVSGAIGFIGLMVPHLLRPLVGHQPGRLLLASAIGGALLLVVTDIAVRLLPTEVELKIGVMTALLGAPFFFFLLWKMRRTQQ